MREPFAKILPCQTVAPYGNMDYLGPFLFGSSGLMLFLCSMYIENSTYRVLIA